VKDVDPYVVTELLPFVVTDVVPSVVVDDDASHTWSSVQMSRLGQDSG
jgi:hypothetical protein